MTTIEAPVTDQPALVVNGVRLLPDSSGALVWGERATLVVADLHLEKGSSFARSGRLLPPYDTAATLAALRAAIARHRPRRVICLGDSFHDGEAAARVPDAAREAIRALTAALEWVWIAGNHDPEPPRGLGGAVTDELTDGALAFRHAPRGGTVAGEIAGHFHPKASVATRGRRITARCFVGDGRRLVLPAFGAYTGGLDALDPAIAGLFPRGFQAALLGRRGVFAFPHTALRPVA